MNARLNMTLAVLIAMAAMTMAMGCGGGGGSTSTAGLSKAAFIKQANAACLKEREDSIERVNAYAKKHLSEGLPRGVLTRTAIVAVDLATVEREIADLRKLPPPAEDEEEIEAILAAQQRALEMAKRPQAKSSPKIAVRYFVGANKKLRAYGLTECVKS